MTIAEIQAEIVAEFSLFSDWVERYEYLIDIGKSLDVLDPKYKIDQNIIKGCQSKVWMHATRNGQKVLFTADSDAILTKGIVALLIRVFSDHDPKSILQANTDFIEQIGLKSHLSPTRANGLVLMVKQIKLYALAYSAQSSPNLSNSNLEKE